MRSASGLLAITFAALAASACSSALVRAAPSLDAGTLGVSGVEAGVGGQVELVGYSGMNATGLGFGAALAFAGYSSAGDADPIVFTTLEGRYRRSLGRAARPGRYWELGTGLGLAWSPGVQAAALPIQAELGLQDTNGGLSWSVGLRERAMLLIGSGSPPLDVHDSIQLIAGLGFPLGPPR